MPKITRVLQRIFAKNASNNGVFGSAQDASKVLTNDVAILQSKPAWLEGWNSATISGGKLPTLEEMQGIQYVLSSQLAYLFQEGIPEYDAATTYYANSIVKAPGSYGLYGSIGNDNTGNALTDASKWVFLVDLAALGGTLSTANYFSAQGQKPSGTVGDSLSANIYANRIVNTVITNNVAGASVVTGTGFGRVILPAGTHFIRAWGNAFGCDRNRMRLRNFTDSTTLLMGSSEYASNAYGGTCKSEIFGLITLAASKTLELDHICNTTGGSQGVYANGGGPEIYTGFESWKVG